MINICKMFLEQFFIIPVISFSLKTVGFILILLVVGLIVNNFSFEFEKRVTGNQSVYNNSMVG